jgi:hypothetical protein
MLGKILISPKAYLDAIERPVRETSKMRVGSLVHAMLLEPTKVKDSFAVWYGYRRGKEFDLFCSNHKHFDAIVSENEMELAKTIVASVSSDVNVMAMLSVPSSIKEKRFFKYDKNTDIELTGKVDDYFDGVICDIKTTHDVSKRGVSNSIARYAYDVQLAAYWDLLEFNGYECKYMRILAIQNIPPYDVVMYEFNDDAMRMARDRYSMAMSTLAECHKNNVFPGIANSKIVVLDSIPRTDVQSEEEITFGGESVF